LLLTNTFLLTFVFGFTIKQIYNTTEELPHPPVFPLPFHLPSTEDAKPIAKPVERQTLYPLVSTISTSLLLTDEAVPMESEEEQADNNRSMYLIASEVQQQATPPSTSFTYQVQNASPSFDLVVYNSMSSHPYQYQTPTKFDDETTVAMETDN
jgi:hypothetical protein